MDDERTRRTARTQLIKRRTSSVAVATMLATAACFTVAAPAAYAVGTVSIANASVGEGNSAVMPLSLGVTFSEPLTAQCEINWTVTGISAVTGVDFTVGTQVSQTFAAGTSGTRAFSPLRVVGDIAFESDETVDVRLVTDTDATADCPIGAAVARVTIANDDPAVAPTVSVADAVFVEGDGNGHNEPIVLTSSPTGVQLSCEIAFQLTSGTATSGADFSVALAGTQMEEGDTTQTLNAVRIFGDNNLEGDETFTLRLVNDGDANLDCPIGDGEATITIVDDDTSLPIRSMTIADTTATEGTATNGTMTFTLQLSGPANGDERVQLDTTAGTATAGADFVPLVAHVVNFAAGQTTASVDVSIVGDSVDEALENFLLVPSNQQNLSFGPHHDARGTIEDDDGNVLPSARIDDATLVEGNSGVSQIGVTIHLDGFAAGNETMTVVSSDGSALVGSDYVAISQPVTFQAGQSTRTIVISANGDTTIEPDEDFTLTLTNPQNVAFSDAIGRVTITNDDVGPPAAPTGLVLADAGVNVGLSWTDNSTNETGFEVQRARWVAGVWSEFVMLAPTAANQTSTTDASLPDGLYAYLVRSKNTAGTSDWLINVIQHNTATTVPNVPGAFSATNTGLDVVLRWTDTNTTEYVHEVGRARFNPTTQTWGEWTFFLADRNATTFTDANPPDGQYAYLVRADNAIGASDWSIIVITHVNSKLAPVAPSGLTATPSTSAVRLAWTDNATNEVVYEIQRAKLIGGNWTGWTTFVLDKNSTAFNNRSLTAGHYAYLVRATNPIGSSAWVTVETDV